MPRRDEPTPNPRVAQSLFPVPYSLFPVPYFLFPIPSVPRSLGPLVSRSLPFSSLLLSTFPVRQRLTFRALRSYFFGTASSTRRFIHCFIRHQFSCFVVHASLRNSPFIAVLSLFASLLAHRRAPGPACCSRGHTSSCAVSLASRLMMVLSLIPLDSLKPRGPLFHLAFFFPIAVILLPTTATLLKFEGLSKERVQDRSL